MNLTVAKGLETDLHILTAQKKLEGLTVRKAEEGAEVGIAEIATGEGEQEMSGEIDPKEQAKQDKIQEQETLAAEIFKLGPDGVDELLKKFRMPPATNLTESIEDLINSQSPALLRGAMTLAAEPQAEDIQLEPQEDELDILDEIDEQFGEEFDEE